MSNIFWDGGSTLSFITTKRAKELKLKGEKIQLSLLTIGAQSQTVNSLIYEVNLIESSGKVHQVHAVGIDKISSSIQPINMNRVCEIFGIGDGEINRPVSGEIDMLIGLQYAAFHPVCVAKEGHLLLYRNQFGLTVGGSHADVVEQTVIEDACLKVQSAAVMHAQLSSGIGFMEMESLGVNCIPRCGSCKCGQCHPGGKDMSLQDEVEYKMIEEKLMFDPVTKRW